MNSKLKTVIQIIGDKDVHKESKYQGQHSILWIKKKPANLNQKKKKEREELNKRTDEKEIRKKKGKY